MPKDSSFKPLKVVPIPVPKGNKHPPIPQPLLMDHEFTLGLIAPKGCGKTTMICNLLMFYKNYFHNILIFSPTINSDDKWDYIKDKDLIVENTPLKKFIKELEDKKKKENHIVETPAEPTGLEGLVNQKDFFESKISEDNFFTAYSDGRLEEIVAEQKTVIDLLKKHGKPKHLANRILVIFDDLVGSSLFAGTKGAFFTGLNTRHRHYSMSMMMVSQGYKEIPKTVRTNWTAIIVFGIGNEKEIEVIYEEFGMKLKSKDWLEMYRYATDDEYGFLYLNLFKPNGLKVMKNFDEYLTIRPKDDGGMEINNV